MAFDKHSIQQNLSALLVKTTDPDPDIRYMSLNDLLDLIENCGRTYFAQDHHSCNRMVDALLKSLEDQNGEVQNQALKCIAPFAPRLPPEILAPFLDKLATLTESQTIDTSVPNTAIRSILGTLPRPSITSVSSREVHSSYDAVSRVLIPRLVGKSRTGSAARGMIEYDPAKGFSSDAIDVLIEVVRSYGPMLHDKELSYLTDTALRVIENDHAGTVVTKRALTAISALSAYFSDNQLSGFVSVLIESFRAPHLTINRRRHLVATIAAVARAIPAKFGPYLKTLAPFVLAVVSEREMNELNEMSDDEEHDPKQDELREAALVTLETLISYCGNEMQPYLNDSIAAALRYLKYDPNVAEIEDEEMGGTQDEGSDDGTTEDPDEDNDDFEDFEEEEGYSDIDDLSWKVRRCSAKVLSTIISTQGRETRTVEDGSIYQKVAPALLSRFTQEREESVKIEVVTTMTGLVRKTSDVGTGFSPDSLLPDSFSKARSSRKRRRTDSDAVIIDFEAEMSAASLDSPVVKPSTPQPGPQADLARLIPGIVQALSKLWKGATIPLKQSAILLLKALALVRYGGLGDYLQRIEDPIADALKNSSLSGGAMVSAGSMSVSAGNLQIDALGLVAAIAETHSSNALLPFLIALIPGVVSSVNDRNYKVAGEALGAIEHIVVALTPPRASAEDQELGLQLEKLFDIAMEKITDNSTDLEVRQRGLHVLGIMLGRASGPDGQKFISLPQRQKALSLLLERLKNETTRVAAARAIDDVALLARNREDITTLWISDVTLEFASQLRKVDRALRDACLGALKSIMINSNTRQHLDKKTLEGLSNALLPLLVTDDLHLVTPTLIILAKMVLQYGPQLVKDGMIAGLCSVVQGPLTGTVLRAYLLLVRVIGEQGAGSKFMKALLQNVGVNGDPAIVGKAIGTLVVYGGPRVGVQPEDFLNELKTAHDNQRKCLALAILGEIGLRMGAKSELKPEIFISNFKAASDKVRLSAAVALGNAGASNIKDFLPVIFEGLEKSSSSKYLLLHSLKEILQHPENVRADVAPFAKRLWEILLAASEDEDNRTVGAECIGRLSLIDPATYIPQLQEYLSHPSSTVRGTVISAFRYTLADFSKAYNDALRPLMVPVLITILNDADLANHRLALTTLNSAIHNKTSMVLPHLTELLPAVMGDTNIKPELVREVQMGPFKHKVDDGLELRKSAYETLYTCLDMAFSAVNPPEVFDRILAGIEDEQDIRTLCNLMISKMIVLAPEETMSHLNSFSSRFRLVLSAKLKDSAVKQEVEKAQEASMGVLKITRELQQAFPGAEASNDQQAWKQYVEWAGKEFGPLLRSIGKDI
ncbi:hypothetical protein FQN57_001275 [Myotisia sp. PD_48]|nr:hypothetical protein FQN57_001275 [Myotisia sp. PD_48]